MARSRFGARAALTAAILLASATAGGAQAPAATSAKPAAATAPPANASSTTEDRIFALVQAGKCGQAKSAAEKADDANLAEQIGLKCGHSPTAGSNASKGGGGGRRGGGGQGAGMSSGRRGG